MKTGLLTLSLTGGWRILPTNFKTILLKKLLSFKNLKKFVILPYCLINIFCFRGFLIQCLFMPFKAYFCPKTSICGHFLRPWVCYNFKIIVNLDTISRPFLNFANTLEGGEALWGKNCASLKSPLQSPFYSDFKFEKCIRSVVIVNAIIFFLYKLSLDFSEPRYWHVKGWFFPAEEQNCTVMMNCAYLK